MEKPALKLVVPETVSGTTDKPRRIMPNRKANDQRRPRPHLLESEIALLKSTAIKVNRQTGFRDAVMISLAFRSCLRVGELTSLTWDCISFEEGTVHIRRLKGSDPSTHKIQGDMLRNLRRLKREQKPSSPFVFTSHGVPISAAGFRKMLARLGVAAGIGFPVNCHMLRHGGLTKLAGDNVDAITLAAYSGHRQLQNLQRYIRLSPEKFKSFRWRD
jgi:integrase